jgi:sigma-54 specific flagellar transcriptional regulator A
MECLTRYAWPGNVRELGNLIERLSILCAGRMVTAADLPARYRPKDWTPPADGDSVPAMLPPPQVEKAAEVVSLPLRRPLAAVVDEEMELALSEREALLAEEPAAIGGILLPPGGIDLRAHVAMIEESLIRQALDRSNGIVAQAARLLGLRRTTLVEKLRKFEIGGALETSED